MQRLLTTALAASIAAALSAQGYVSNFESLNASAAGTLLTGQDQWYLPAVANSADWNVHTYAGNPFGTVAHPNGGNNFIAGRPTLVGTVVNSARTQRPNTFDSISAWRLTFDVNCQYLGTGTPVNNIGSGSTQPSTTAAYINCLARWPTTVSTPPGATWNADFVYFTAANVNTTGSLPDVRFQGLTSNHWYTWTIEFDFVSNRILAIEIVDLTGPLQARFEPADWYMFGGAVTPFPPLPTDFRFFGSGDVNNVFAVDNVFLLPVQYSSYGTGCVGSNGTPALAAVTGSLPQLGTTFQAQLSNMPTAGGAALMALGFSETTYGAFTLPFDLAPLGAAGCRVMISPDFNSFVLNAAGSGVWSLPIPNVPALSGARFLNQGLVFDTAANLLGLTVTNARRGYIR